MRVRLTDAPDGGVYLESPYNDWAPVLEDFKVTIPRDGRSWDSTMKKWIVTALYVTDLLAFLSQHQAHIQDDRQPAAAGEIRLPMPDDLREAFAALHLAASAPLCVAEASYRALSKYYHPDMGGTPEDFHGVSDAIRIIRRYLDPQDQLDDDIPF